MEWKFNDDMDVKSLLVNICKTFEKMRIDNLHFFCGADIYIGNIPKLDDILKIINQSNDHKHIAEAKQWRLDYYPTLELLWADFLAKKGIIK
jgi:hypothetical protein